MPVYKYFYISRNATYPVCNQVTYKNHYAIVEMECEANTSELLVNDLLYVGHGVFGDKHIQDNLRRYEDNMQLYERR